MTAYHFFLKHGGYSYNSETETKAQGRRRCAKWLADAEAKAQSVGLVFEWVNDDDADLSWLAEGETVNEVLGCIVRSPSGRVMASLWGITDPSREYGRVIEAELAGEVFASHYSAAWEGVTA